MEKIPCLLVSNTTGLFSLHLIHFIPILGKGRPEKGADRREQAGFCLAEFYFFRPKDTASESEISHQCFPSFADGSMEW
jgi:hypothetical protein